MAAPDTVIETRNVTRLYALGGTEVRALDSVSLTIRRGEFVAIMGSSGSGKSTLMNVLGCLDRPSSGQYLFEGIDVAGLDEPALAQIRSERIGFVFQSFNLIDELNVSENVELALLYHEDVSAAERKKRVAEALNRMKISHRARHMPSQLSGGQQQRVAIARAVVKRPKLILADEPTGNLDTANGEEVMQLLTQLNEEGTTIVMVTHSHSHAEYAHRIVNLLDGAIVTESIRQVL